MTSFWVTRFRNSISQLENSEPPESLKANKKQWKRSLILKFSFAQNTSLILQTSTYSILKKYAPATQPFSLYKFSSKHLLGVKKHLHCTISRLPRTAFLKQFKSKCLYFGLSPQENFCSKDAVSFYVVGCGYEVDE